MKISNLRLFQYLAKRLFLLGCITALIAIIFFAFSTSVEAQDYRFSTVTIEGTQRIDPDTVLSYAGIKRGQNISADELDAAKLRIEASGLFKKVEVEPRGSRLLIRVAEYPTINKIAFEGNKKIKDKDLEGFIESRPRQVFSPTKAERDAAVITEAYLQNGRIAARVTPRVIRRSDNRVDLVFEIFEGKKIEIQRIGFVGNRAYSDRRLRRVINSKQAGLLRAFINSDTFVADRIEFDKQLLTDFYQSRGYVDFRITGTNAELSRVRDGYFVTFNIQEGQQFRFGEITTISEFEGADADEFQSTLKIKPGVVYSPTLVEESISRMERLAVKKGFDFLRVEPRVTRNDRDLTLDVEFALTKGPRIFVERIDIKGNTTTLDQVIRRQFHTVEGDPFNPREIRQAAERIRALGYFETADVNAREGSRPDQVVVDVDVKETTTGTLSFGLTFSSSTGVGATAGFSERNFLGRGQSLTAQISGSADRLNFAVDFTEPAFLGRDVEFGLNASFGTSSGATNQFYDTRIAEFRPRLVFPIGENTRLGLFYFVRYADILNYDGSFQDDPATAVVEPNGVLKLEELQGGLTATGPGYTFSYDTRRTGLNPNAGVLLSFSQEFAGLLGDYDYVRSTGRAVAQTAVFGEDVILRASFEGGALNTFGSQKSRVVDRFSNQIMRGFEIGGIGPKQGSEFLGGDYFSALKFEAEFPLGLPDEYGITGGVFYDIGAIWGLNRTNAAAPLSSTGFHDRHAAGVSLFWTSPFGPIRMNFSRAIRKQPGDIVQNFEFTVKSDF